jgi:hypothetical protein
MIGSDAGLASENRTVRPGCDCPTRECGSRVSDSTEPTHFRAGRRLLWASKRSGARMSDELLSSREAARRLGITVTTLYDWLGQSDRRLLVIRGQRVSINYLQGGPQGQGRIRIEAAEVERLKNLMRVRSEPHVLRRPPIPQDIFPGITVPLGRPDC